MTATSASSQTQSSYPVDPLKLYWLVAGATGLWLAWESLFFGLVTYSFYADYWEHTALLTEWLRDIGNPQNPHVADPSSSPRYMPLFLVLTLFGQTLSLDSVQLMGISSIVNYILIVIGIRLFFFDYFRDSTFRQAAPLIAFVVLFFGWGVSWVWSNLYQLRSFFYVAGYPSSFVFGLGLIGFWLTLRILREETGEVAGAVAMLLLAALMFLSHPLTGAFAIGSSGLLALVWPGAQLRRRLLVMAALLAGALLAELWPWFSVWEVVLDRSGNDETSWMHTDGESGVLDRIRSGVWLHIFYRPKFVLLILGFGLPAVFAWLAMTKSAVSERRHWFIVLGGLAMLIPYFAHIVVSVPLAHRFLLFAIFYFHMAAVALLLKLLEVRQAQLNSGGLSPLVRWTSVAAGIWVIAAVVFNISQLVMEYNGMHLRVKTLTYTNKFENIPEGGNVVDLYQDLTAGVGPYDVVMATGEIAWPLPTVTGKAVSIYHQNPLLPDQWQRAEAVARFFAEGASDSERAAILAQYDVKFVLIREDSTVPDMLEWLPSVAEETARRGSYRMYRLKTAGS